MLIDDLPIEILIYIIKFLDNISLKRLAVVNKLFFEISKENKVLEVLYNNNTDFQKLPRHLSLINHCYKIDTLIDNKACCKFYLHKYGELFKNKLNNLILSSCDCAFKENEISIILENNKSLKNLILNINFNELESKYYKNISFLKKLKTLSLKNSYISAYKLKENFKDLKLDSLELIHFPNLTFFNLNIPTLTKITLNRCQNIDLEFLSLFLSRHPNLNYIDLCNMPYNIRISIAIARYCKKIKYLDLSYPDGVINDLDLALICSHCREINYIDLSCTFITEKTAFSLTYGCKNLKILKVPYTGITNDGLSRIINKLNRLEILDLRHTLITKKSLKILKNKTNLYYRIDQDIL